MAVNQQQQQQLQQCYYSWPEHQYRWGGTPTPAYRHGGAPYTYGRQRYLRTYHPPSAQSGYPEMVIGQQPYTAKIATGVGREGMRQSEIQYRPGSTVLPPTRPPKRESIFRNVELLAQSCWAVPPTYEPV